VALDVFFNAAAATGARTDVVEGFGVFDAMFSAESAAAGNDEFADVTALGGDVVIAE